MGFAIQPRFVADPRAIPPALHGYRWGSEMPFRLEEDDFNGGEVTTIEDALEEFNTRTDLTIRQWRENDLDFVLILKGELPFGATCTSKVGRQGFEQRIICSEDRDVNIVTMVHELCHAFGIIHEHQRGDRDEHVTVHSNAPDYVKNPKYPVPHTIQNFSAEGIHHRGYDCLSISHYNFRGGTIHPKEDGCEEVGHSGWNIPPYLSDGDVATINAMVAGEL